MRRIIWAGISVLAAGLAVAGAVVLPGRNDDGGQSADPAVERGRQVVEACTVCHAIARQDPPRVGPPLWDIVDAPKARTDGFGYSAALAAADGIWDAASLDAFLRDPQGYLPGTAMVFNGIADDDDRASAIAFLRTQAPR